VSNKISVLTLDGKTLHRNRCRSQRLVDAGTHQWIGPRTVREVKPPEKALALSDRVIQRRAVIFDADYFYPSLEPHPELHDLPFTYPLPYELLKCYQSPRQDLAS